MKLLWVPSPGLCLLTVTLMTASCWSKFILLEKGIKPFSLKSLAFTFYAAIQNDGSGLDDLSKIPIRLQMILCCQHTGKSRDATSLDLDMDVDTSSLSRDTNNWDCQSMIVHSGLAFHVRRNQSRLLIGYFLNKHLLNRQGICTFQIHNAPSIPPFSIHFSTRIKKLANENLEPALLDANNSQKKLEVCDFLDLDPLEKCRPVNCMWKYTGFRSFYNSVTKLCEPTPICEELHVDSHNLRAMDHQEHYPSLVLDIKTNNCVNQTDDTIVKSPIKSRSLEDSADGKIIVHKDSSVGDFTVAYGLTLTKLAIAVILTCTFIILICVVLNFFCGCWFCNLGTFNGKGEKNGPSSCNKSKSQFKSPKPNNKRNLFGKKSSQKYEPLRTSFGDSSPEAADKVIEEIKDRREMKAKPISQSNFSHPDLHEAVEDYETEEEEMEHESLSKARLSTQNVHPMTGNESPSKKYTSPPKSQQSTIQSPTTMTRSSITQSPIQQAQSPQQKLSTANSTQGQTLTETTSENPPSPKKTLPNVVQFLQHFQKSNFPYLTKAKTSDELKHKKSYFELYEAFGKPCPGKGKKIVRSLDTESSITFQREQPQEHRTSQNQKYWSPSTTGRVNNNNDYYSQPTEIPNPNSQRIHLGHIPRFNQVIHKIQAEHNHVQESDPTSTAIPVQGESPRQHKNIIVGQKVQNSTQIHDQQIEVISQRLNSQHFLKDSQESSDCTMVANSHNYSSPHKSGYNNQGQNQNQHPGQQQKHFDFYENPAQQAEPEVSLPSWASVSSFNVKAGSAPTPTQSQNPNRMFSPEMLEAMNLMKELERRSQREAQIQNPNQQHNPVPVPVDDISHASLHNQASASPRLMRRIKDEPPIPMSMIYGNTKTEFHDLGHKVEEEFLSPDRNRETYPEKPPRPPPYPHPLSLSRSQSRGSLRSSENQETGSDKNSPVQSASSSRNRAGANRKSSHHHHDQDHNSEQNLAGTGQDYDSMSQSPMPMSRHSNSSLLSSTTSVPSIQGRINDLEQQGNPEDFKSQSQPFTQYNLMVEEQTKCQTNAAQKIFESALRLQKEINGGEQRPLDLDLELDFNKVSNYDNNNSNGYDSTKKEESLDDFPKPSQLQLQQELHQNFLQDLSTYEFSGTELEFEARSKNSNSQNSIFSHQHTENKNDDDNQDETDDDADENENETETETETEAEIETENEKENNDDEMEIGTESDEPFEDSLTRNIFNLNQQQSVQDCEDSMDLVHSPSNLTTSELSCSVSTSNSSLSDLIQEQLRQTETRNSNNNNNSNQVSGGGNIMEDFWSNEFQLGPGPGLEYSSGSGSSSSPSDQAVQKAFWIENFVCPRGNQEYKK